MLLDRTTDGRADGRRFAAGGMEGLAHATMRGARWAGQGRRIR
jgi:hypothetical protein